MCRLLSTVFCSVLATANLAHAGDFDGAYVAFGLGTSTTRDSQTNYSTDDGGYASGIPNGYAAILSDRGALASVSGGYTWALSGFLVGIDGRVDRRGLNVTVFETEDGITDTNFTTSYESNLSRQLSLRFGKMVQTDYMAYIKLGRSWADYSRTYTDIGNDLEETVSGTDRGNVFGLGMEFKWTETWNVNVDLSRVVYDRSVATLTSVYEEDVTHDNRENTLTVMIVKRF